MHTADSDGGLDRRGFIKGVTAGVAGVALTGAAAGDVFADEKPPAQVKRRPLGKTGIDASVMIYGCGGTRPEHLPLLQKAFASGVNTFDVAWGYQRGQAEVAVGQFLKTLKDRSKAYVITKTTGFRPPNASAKEVYKALRERLMQSLKRLQTDYVDVLYCPHGATDPAQFANKALEDALLKLKEEKLVKHVGASSHTNYRRVGEAAVEKSWCEVFMPVANICTQNATNAGALQQGRKGRGRALEDTKPMLAVAKKKKVGLVAMKVANPGYLSAKTDALLAEQFPKDSQLSRHQKLYTYMLGQEGVSAVVVGIRSVLHLKEMIAVGTAVKA